MRPNERSKLLAYVEELGETERTNTVQGGSTSERREEVSIEMKEIGGTKSRKKNEEKQKLDENDIKSDEFVVVLER